MFYKDRLIQAINNTLSPFLIVRSSALCCFLFYLKEDKATKKSLKFLVTSCLLNN
jgi:hypothetical protein